ncbi:transposase [Nocardia heshunensis]
MTPPTARTWAPRGHTPVVTVRGRSRRRISIAALACYRPGHRSRLIYRPRRDSENRNRRKSFAWTDYRDLLICAHHQLGALLVVVWDNLGTHTMPPTRQFVADHDWLTVYQLPAYAADLNLVEVVWSLLRRPMANTAFTDRAPHRRPPHRPQTHPAPSPPNRRLLGRDRPRPRQPIMTTSRIEVQ